MTSLYSSSRAKERLHLAERFDQRVHVLLGVVHVEGGPGGRRDPKTSHQDLGAMMARTDAHSLLVEDLGHVMGMDVPEPERDRTASGFGVVGPEHRRSHIPPSSDRLPA